MKLTIELKIDTPVKPVNLEIENFKYELQANIRSMINKMNEDGFHCFKFKDYIIVTINKE